MAIITTYAGSGKAAIVFALRRAPPSKTDGWEAQARTARGIYDKRAPSFKVAVTPRYGCMNHPESVINDLPLSILSQFFAQVNPGKSGCVVRNGAHMITFVVASDFVIEYVFFVYKSFSSSFSTVGGGRQKIFWTGKKRWQMSMIMS
jgi:hypothetical protein